MASRDEKFHNGKDAGTSHLFDPPFRTVQSPTDSKPCVQSRPPDCVLSFLMTNSLSVGSSSEGKRLMTTYLCRWDGEVGRSESTYSYVSKDDMRKYCPDLLREFHQDLVGRNEVSELGSSCEVESRDVPDFGARRSVVTPTRQRDSSRCPTSDGKEQITPRTMSRKEFRSPKPPEPSCDEEEPTRSDNSPVRTPAFQRPRFDVRQEETGPRILWMKIKDPTHPIIVSVIKTVCEEFGRVVRIVIVDGITSDQVFVEFDSAASAMRAAFGLRQRPNIFGRYSTLTVEFSRKSYLAVERNDSKTYDFTRPHHLSSLLSKERRVDPTESLLIGEPKPTSTHNFPPGTSDSGRGFGTPFHQEYRRTTASEDYDVVGTSDGSSAAGADLSREPLDDRGRVVQFEGFDPRKMNCDRLFNLVCLYGNVMKICFPSPAANVALVEMMDPAGALECAELLNGVPLHGASLLRASLCQQVESAIAYTTDRWFHLPCGSASVIDYRQSCNNRFLLSSEPKPGHVVGTGVTPNRVLYFYNAPPRTDSNRFLQFLRAAGAPIPRSVEFLEAQNSREAHRRRKTSGTLVFESLEDAIEALMLANNINVRGKSDDRHTYSLKLVFAAADGPEEAQDPGEGKATSRTGEPSRKRSHADR